MGGRTTTFASTPTFIADGHSISREPGGRQIDWAQVGEAYRTTAEIVKANGAAAQGATAITVDPLPIALQSGQLLYFGGSQEFARLTANAAEGATSITVEALPQGIEDNDEAIVGGTGPKTIPAGTVMAELSGGKVVPRAARPGAETAIGLLESSADEDSKTDALSGYGLVIGGVVYENLLPDATGTPAVLPSDYKTEMQAAGVGTGFAFRQYADDTGS